MAWNAPIIISMTAANTVRPTAVELGSVVVLLMRAPHQLLLCDSGNSPEVTKCNASAFLQGHGTPRGATPDGRVRYAPADPADA